MEEQNSAPDPEFVKNFNEGYTLAKYMPELAEKLSVAIGESERGLGFQKGREEFLNEIDKERYPSWLDEKDDFEPDRNEPEKDKEDFEPEKE